MNNIILIAVETVISYVVLTILARKYKTDGIYLYGIIATFVVCLMNLKKIAIMGINIPIGMGLTTSIIIGGNIITQKRGFDELKPYIILIIVSAVLSCCFINLSMLLTDSKYNLEVNQTYNNIFTGNIRVYLAFILSVIPSIYLSSKLYSFIKRMQNQLLLNNIFAVVITEFIENIIFICVLYISELQPLDIVLCIVFRYVIKFAAGILGTIPLYIVNKYN